MSTKYQAVADALRAHIQAGKYAGAAVLPSEFAIAEEYQVSRQTVRQALSLLMASLRKPRLLLLDEHTAALDPKTAEKVLELSDRIVEESHLTTMMVTHNMKDAIAHGNRLIMMYDGRIVVDVSGEEKKKLTVPQLLELFGKASGSDEADDKLLLS